MPNQMGYLSLALYAASFLCYARLLYAPDVWLGRLATLLLAGGIALHYFALLDRSMGTHAVPYDDLYGSMSLFAWLLGITYLGVELFHRQRSVGAFVTLLLVVWMAVLGWLAPHQMPAPPPSPSLSFLALSTWCRTASCARTAQALHSGAFPHSTCWIACRAAAFSSDLWRWCSALPAGWYESIA